MRIDELFDMDEFLSGRHGMNARFVDVTPELAQEIVAKAGKNRAPSDKTVSNYMILLRRGAFLTTHQGIGIDDDGELFDGLHRLMAIIKTGIGARMLVTTGVPKIQRGMYTMGAVDLGRQRSLGDFLSIFKNIKNPNLHLAIGSMMVSMVLGTTFKMSDYLFEQLYDIYKDEFSLVMGINGHVRRLNTAPPLAAFVMAMKTHPEEAFEFEDKYFSGENLTKTSPIMVYRNFVMSKHGVCGYTYRKMIAYNAFTCIKHFIEGKHMKKLFYGEAGFEFFMKKQRKAVEEIRGIFK